MAPHYMERGILYSTAIALGKVPPLRVTVTEGVNRTVECCVQITGPDMSTTIQRDDFSVCVSTINGTAVGKNIVVRLLGSAFWYPFFRLLYTVLP